MSLTTAESGNVTLSKARQMVCLEAAWELEALASVLPTLVPFTDDDWQVNHAVRGIAGRIKSLSHVLASAVHDEVETTDALERKVLMK